MAAGVVRCVSIVSLHTASIIASRPPTRLVPILTRDHAGHATRPPNPHSRSPFFPIWLETGTGNPVSRFGRERETGPRGRRAGGFGGLHDSLRDFASNPAVTTLEYKGPMPSVFPMPSTSACRGLSRPVLLSARRWLCADRSYEKFLTPESASRHSLRERPFPPVRLGAAVICIAGYRRPSVRCNLYSKYLECCRLGAACRTRTPSRSQGSRCDAAR